MKTNNLTNGIVTAVVIGTVIAGATVRVSANVIPTIAVSVSYFAVAVLLVLAAIDYRTGPKSYLTR